MKNCTNHDRTHPYIGTLIQFFKLLKSWKKRLWDSIVVTLCHRSNRSLFRYQNGSETDQIGACFVLEGINQMDLRITIEHTWYQTSACLTIKHIVILQYNQSSTVRAVPHQPIRHVAVGGCCRIRVAHRSHKEKKTRPCLHQQYLYHANCTHGFHWCRPGIDLFIRLPLYLRGAIVSRNTCC